MKSLVIAALALLIIPSFGWGSWQENLESQFDHVVTFDTLDAWQPTTTGSNVVGSPTGDSSIIAGYAIETATTRSVIQDFGDYTWNPTGELSPKSICIENGEGDGVDDHPRLIGQGVSKLLLFWGEGDPDTDTDYTSMHMFFMIKYKAPDDHNVSTGYQWTQYSGETYVLEASGGGDPNISVPSYASDDGVQLNRIDNASYWENLTTAKDNLDRGEWVYNDTGNGYYSLYVRLSDGSDPDNSTMTYSTSSFVMQTATTPWQVGTYKFLFFKTGFRSVLDYKDLGFDTDVYDNGQNQTTYGTNFTNLNVASYGVSNLGWKQAIAPAYWNGTTWQYWAGGTYGLENRKLDSTNTDGATDITFLSKVLNNEWFGMEVKVNLGTLNTKDGSIEVWIYDSDGTEYAHDKIENDWYLREFDHVLNKIGIGGNRFGVNYGYDSYDPHESIWYMDDIIIDGDRIGPTYFQMINGNPPPTPAVNHHFRWNFVTQ